MFGFAVDLQELSEVRGQVLNLEKALLSLDLSLHFDAMCRECSGTFLFANCFSACFPLWRACRIQMSTWARCRRPAATWKAIRWSPSCCKTNYVVFENVWRCKESLHDGKKCKVDSMTCWGDTHGTTRPCLGKFIKAGFNQAVGEQTWPVAAATQDFWQLSSNTTRSLSLQSIMFFWRAPALARPLGLAWPHPVCSNRWHSRSGRQRVKNGAANSKFKLDGRDGKASLQKHYSKEGERKRHVWFHLNSISGSQVEN